MAGRGTARGRGRAVPPRMMPESDDEEEVEVDIPERGEPSREELQRRYGSEEGVAQGVQQISLQEPGQAGGRPISPFQEEVEVESPRPAGRGRGRGIRPPDELGVGARAREVDPQMPPRTEAQAPPRTEAQAPPRTEAQAPVVASSVPSTTSTGTGPQRNIAVTAAERTASASGYAGDSISVWSGHSGSGHPPQPQEGMDVEGAPGAGAQTGQAKDTTKDRVNRFMVDRRLVGEKVIKKGDKGTLIKLAANFIRLEFLSRAMIYEYHVDFTPEIDRLSTRITMLMEALQGSHPGRNFDGTMLFVSEKLADDVNETIVWELYHPTTRELHRVVAKFVKEKPMTQVNQFFNILFNRLLREGLNFSMMKRSFFDPAGLVQIRQHKMEIWPGYDFSVDEMEDGWMVCVDVASRVLRTDTVLQEMETVGRGLQDQSRRDAIENFLLSRTVVTTYNNIAYKISEVEWRLNPTSTFDKKGVQIKYVDYYRTRHSRDIQDLSQPLLISILKPRSGDTGVTKTVSLVPELCHLTGLTDEQRQNFKVMTDLAKYTRLDPMGRKTKIDEFISRVIACEKRMKILEAWGFTIKTAPITIDGRVAEGPTLIFQKGKELRVGADFGRESGQGVYHPKPVETFLFVYAQKDEALARKFVQQYSKECANLSIPITGRPVMVGIPRFQTADFRKAIRDNYKNEYQFLLCLMPVQRDDLYAAIKQIAVSELMIPSQCMLTRTISNEKRFRSIVQKIAMQINCKLGGSLWGLKMPEKSSIMFVGIDVAHDPLKKQNSTIGVIASLNRENTKYISIVNRESKVHEEIGQHLRTALIEALNTYNGHNGCFPSRVVVFRDGGLKEPTSFSNSEVAQMKRVVEESPGAEGTTFTYVVVQKRISQRFFKTDATGTRWENAPPGTIVDHTVTSYDQYDFYVVSQLVRQGTVTPTHYVVTYDSGDTRPDLLQKMAYATSFMYYNWPGTVRVPAVTQYAHKLVTLIGNHVRMDPGHRLNETLYYL